MQERGQPHYSQLDLAKLQEMANNVEARKQDLLLRDLAPYEDDDFLVERMGGQSRILRRAPELNDQITHAFLADDDESLIEVADKIDTARQLHAPKNEKPINALFSYISLMDACNQHAFSVGADTAPRLNALDMLLTKKFTDSIIPELLDDAYLSIKYLLARIRGILKDLEGDLQSTQGLIDMSPLSIMELRLEGLRQVIWERDNAYTYVDALRPDNPNEHTSPKEAANDSLYTAELFHSIRSTQKYGLKMGYVNDDRRGGTLIFSPPINPRTHFPDIEAHPNIHPLVLQWRSIAEVIHSRKKRHSSLKRTREDSEEYVSIVYTNIEALIALSIGEDGELYTSRDCRTSLRDIALQRQRYGAYRDLQATILAHYFDLTHPLDEVIRIQKNLQTTPYVVDETTRPSLVSIERLVIPRVIRRDQQSTAGEVDNEDLPIRTVRRHDVIWHTRKLPPGWRASPDAIELAKSLGVTLAEDETIVKEHKRGSKLLGEVAAHRFVKQPGHNRRN